MAKKTQLHAQFCQKLIKARERHSISRSDLAARMGVAVTYIYDLERGRHSPSLDVVQRVADGLGMDVEIRFTKK